MASGLLPETGDRPPLPVTEVPFTLPRGYVDADGALHRDGAFKDRPWAAVRGRRGHAGEPNDARSAHFMGRSAESVNYRALDRPVARRSQRPSKRERYPKRSWGNNLFRKPTHKRDRRRCNPEALYLALNHTHGVRAKRSSRHQ